MNGEIKEISIKQPFWAMSVKETLAALRTDASGLSTEEAAGRLEIFGLNQIEERSKMTVWKIILNQFKSPLIIVLIAAGLITIFLEDWIDAGVIFAAVIANTALGFYQENKAETALALLKTYILARARVRRSGKESEIDAVKLAPGDVIRISQGDRVPADCRLIFANNLEVDESILTGESLPVEKDAASLPGSVVLAERRSMVFSGTLAVAGFADAAVTATGGDTEFGKIAGLVAEKERELTPLQRAISRFTVKASLILGALTLTLFGLGLYFGRDLLEMFLIAVAVAVSAVPEGLPVALTVILAVGVQRLAGKKGIVRRLLAAETLGSTSLILTDKTGTLTQAKMQLASVSPFGRRPEDAGRLISLALANTDVVLENPEAPLPEWKIFGRPLEVALILGAAERGIYLKNVLEESEIVDRLPFNSERKFSVAVARKDSRYNTIIFGAPEIILDFTDASKTERQGIMAEIYEAAARGERVLGVVSKESPLMEKIENKTKFKHFRFEGLVTFRDPLRPHVAGAIRRIAAAGVRTVILTGDHQGTAEAVARELGMIDGRGAVLTGSDIAGLTAEELKNRAGAVSVYARVTPEQKLMIAKLYKERGEVVAVTGDGINDAPALQAADIGVAVGSGTDVAKSAADLVILDDNFETIVTAIEEGRKILANIRKVIVYLLSDAANELFLIGGSLFMGLALPINALQILFVNFFSDSFPAVAFAFEKGVDDLDAKPKKLHKSLLDGEIRFLILIIGIFTSAVLFTLYFLLLKFGFPPNIVRTFIFASFGTYTLFLAFALRSLEKSIFSYNPFSNPYLSAGVGIGLVLTGLVLYLEPLQEVFDVTPLPAPWLLAVLGVGFFNIILVELGKWLFRKQIL